MLKQLVIEQFSHRETKRIPYSRLECEPPLERILTEAYGSEGWKGLCRNATQEVAGFSVQDRDLGGGRYLDHYGTLWEKRGGEGIEHIVEPVIKEPTLAALKALRFPEPEVLADDAWIEHINAQRAAHLGLFTTVSWGYGLFERIWWLCGFEDALCYMITEPSFYRDLADLVIEHQIALAHRFCLSDADAVFQADDWGEQRAMLMSPALWREVIRPRYARFVAAVKSHGKYLIHHSCGHIVPIVGDLCDIGVDVLQSVQPEAMSPYALKEQFGDRLSFWGGLGSQRLMPFGTPAEIKQEVEKLCRSMAKGGGYLLGPAKKLQKDTPPENFFALAEAFNDALDGKFSA